MIVTIEPNDLARREEVPPRARRPLLGALAGRAGLGETFATEALAVILQSPALKHAFLQYLQRRLGTDLSHVVRLLTEVDHGVFGRTDIEGQDSTGRPALIIEAKFGASLTVEQVARYLRLQSSEPGDIRPGLLLLMPEARVEDAIHLLQQAERSVQHLRSATTSVSWTEVLDTLDAALGENERGSNSPEADIIQLRALVDARTKFVLRPVVPGDWRLRRVELAGLVDLVTQRLADALGVWRGPHIARRDIAFAPAYYLKVAGPVPNTYVAVGLHGGFAAEGLTPLWLRFHKVTGDGFAVKRIQALLGDTPEYGSSIRFDGGHLWTPVELDKNLADEALVDDIVRRVRSVLVAAGAESPNLQA
ncbi:hypothetical protein [uncultured Amnibacterium sp.]|uniref:hypothetical protein n=1 Tax=uncultured Amnibacterium sp. TaxID=1631851 RepID=UPI0035CB5856